MVNLRLESLLWRLKVMKIAPRTCQFKVVYLFCKLPRGISQKRNRRPGSERLTTEQFARIVAINRKISNK